MSPDSNKQKTVICSGLTEKCGEIPPKVEIPVQKPNINSNTQYIVGHTYELKKHGEILPDTAVKGETDKMYENYTWLTNPVNCVSKWSKALKMGIENSVGMESCHTALRNPKENDSLGFSFFL